MILIRFLDLHILTRHLSLYAFAVDLAIDASEHLVHALKALITNLKKETISYAEAKRCVCLKGITYVAAISAGMVPGTWSSADCVENTFTTLLPTLFRSFMTFLK